MTSTIILLILWGIAGLIHLGLLFSTKGKEKPSWVSYWCLYLCYIILLIEKTVTHWGA